MAERSGAAVLVARRISKSYRRRRWLFGADDVVKAISDVSLSIWPAARIALVGQSGCGKTTLARCLTGFERPDTGEVLFDGREVFNLSAGEQRAARRRVQLIQQSAVAALNPRLSVEEIVAEPLVIAGIRPAIRHERVQAVMADVGLPASWGRRRPADLSGGQRQRLALARALCAEPRVLILDEALSGLDLPVQTQVIDLLLNLQASHQVAYVFITHDLRLAAHICNDVAVMHRGQIVEHAAREQLFSNARHGHTRQLIAAIRRWGYATSFESSQQ